MPLDISHVFRVHDFKLKQQNLCHLWQRFLPCLYCMECTGDDGKKRIAMHLASTLTGKGDAGVACFFRYHNRHTLVQLKMVIELLELRRKTESNSLLAPRKPTTGRSSKTLRQLMHFLTLLLLEVIVQSVILMLIEYFFNASFCCYQDSSKSFGEQSHVTENWQENYAPCYHWENNSQ